MLPPDGEGWTFDQQTLGGHIEINATFDDDVVSLDPIVRDLGEQPG